MRVLEKVAGARSAEFSRTTRTSRKLFRHIFGKTKLSRKKNVRKNSATLWKLHPHVEQKPTFRPSVAHVCLAALAPKMAKRRPLCSSLKELRTRLLGM